MEDIVDTKGIEKISDTDEVKVEEVEQVKPKRKPRSEAQKAAFEKARLKRAENLAAKKLEDSVDETIPTEEKQIQVAASSETDTEALTAIPQSKPKRGRPKGSKKLKREPVPEQPNFLPPNIPPEAGELRYQYQQPNPYQFNPWMGQFPPQQFPQQPPQQAPQVHNYYYGHQPHQQHQHPVSPQAVEQEEEEEEYYSEEEEYQSISPNFAPPPSLKYRFG
tara:strand:- start:571 stop:1230 length:660 start_codon:yes stop_codon:yes gene_type:complete